MYIRKEKYFIFLFLVSMRKDLLKSAKKGLKIALMVELNFIFEIFMIAKNCPMYADIKKNVNFLLLLARILKSH